jgi:putative endonuclease
MKAPHLIRGRASEHIARRWLLRRGLEFIEANYCCPVGELDLVMLEDDCLVFIEVRYRRTNHYGGALESVTLAKQARLGRAAEHFLQRRNAHQRRPVRFDVIAISGKHPLLAIDWCRNAFFFGQQ